MEHIEDSELKAFEESLAADRNEFMERRSADLEAYKKTKTVPPWPAKPKAVDTHFDTTPPASRERKKSARSSLKPKEFKQRPVHRVLLRVRKKQLAVDEVFSYDSYKLSKLESEIDARKAAKEAGWGVVTYVIDFLKP